MSEQFSRHLVYRRIVWAIGLLVAQVVVWLYALVCVLVGHIA